ncbi:MAG: hypothetical protein M0Z50_12115 [Planctomycetia bacterium]|nr:hypothetical protein [Planctomycetia bacterium]
MSAFTKGLGIFWRTELRLVVLPLATITSAVVMAVAFIFSIAGLARGFWLFHAPMHTSWDTVWVYRRSAMLWLIFIAYALYRHIVRLGDLR